MATESLPCKLNDEETLNRTRKLLDLLQREDELEQEKKSFNERHKEATTVACAETKSMRMVVSMRTEYREIEVAESHDYKRGIVEVIRTDTDEIVRTRAMSKEERQSPLFNDDGEKRNRA